MGPSLGYRQDDRKMQVDHWNASNDSILFLGVIGHDLR